MAWLTFLLLKGNRGIWWHIWIKQSNILNSLKENICHTAIIRDNVKTKPVFLQFYTAAPKPKSSGQVSELFKLFINWTNKAAQVHSQLIRQSVFSSEEQLFHKRSPSSIDCERWRQRLRWMSKHKNSKVSGQFMLNIQMLNKPFLYIIWRNENSIQLGRYGKVIFSSNIIQFPFNFED